MLKNLRNKLNEKKNKKGFTLIELIIVIAIIAILAALLLPKLGAVKENSNKTADISTAKTIADAAITLYADEKLDMSKTLTKLEIKSGASDNAKVIADYLQTEPKVKSKSTGITGFFVDITSDGVVKVYGDSTGAIEIYPNASSALEHK